MEGYLEFRINYLLKMSPSAFENWLIKIHLEHELLDVTELKTLFKNKKEYLRIINKIVK